MIEAERRRLLQLGDADEVWVEHNRRYFGTKANKAYKNKCSVSRCGKKAVMDRLRRWDNAWAFCAEHYERLRPKTDAG